MTDRTVNCWLCHHPIDFQYGRWVHHWSGSIWCGQDGRRLAAPNREWYEVTP